MAAFSFEVSGKIKAPTAEQLAALDAESSVLAYTSGTMPDGRHFYAYVAVTPSRYAEFHRKTAAREQMIIGEYGEVIEGGFEASAPADIRQRMREEYGNLGGHRPGILLKTPRRRVAVTSPRLRPQYA